ncbi:TPA: hypothetical protein DIV49_03220, partial [Candidatus Saccharibacteria bacterium]|nr:hypothetical protein [Candidatus Saccharibacteria bacterium]
FTGNQGARTIVTKSGSKMAFVGIEDKTGESELVVFPDLYSKVANDLKQDVVLRAVGKVNARDRDGNETTDVKLIADEIMIVSDKELAGYESTGRAMKKPKPRASSVTVTKKAVPVPTYEPQLPSDKKLYVHIEDPDDDARLMALKEICAKHPGTADIVLVLGVDKKSAIKLPFKIDESSGLIEELSAQLGKESVKLR